MKLLDIVTAPWMITPERLVEIQEIYITHLRGEKIDIGEVEARIGKKLENEERPYDVIDGVAVVYIDGVMAKRMNLFHRISGGVSTQLIARDFRDALESDDVESIVLYVDSPGGAVDGTRELATEVFAARGKKPVIAYTDGMMASAAYYVASAADRIYISGDTTDVGSVGVVARHIDISKYEEKLGVKSTEIYAGKYKRIASQHAPLSEEGRQSIQERVDYIYNVFVRDVARFRGLSLKAQSGEGREFIPWADGRLFIGHQAITAGLVDGVSTLEALCNRLREEKNRFLAREAWNDALERRKSE